MCPDEILDFYGDYKTRAYYTTLMVGDVSGFTELTEKYTISKRGGPSKLTETLNSYIGPMVQEILLHHGDVLKFSGDAFIVMWKLQEDMVMRDLANEAIQTACIIQKHFGSYETDVGVTLRVKLAIASGRINFTSIGNYQKISHYIITGQPVWDVKYAEGLCKGGDIIVAPSSWQWANPSEYVFKVLPDGIHTLILACNIMWNHGKGVSGYEESENETNAESYTEERIFPKLLILANDPSQSELTFNTDYSLRPKVIKVAKQGLKNALRSYILRPVVRSVELDQPLEYLTEMRQVVIVFVNVVTGSIGEKKLIALVDTTYKLICGIVSEMEGCVNKTSLFDKDLMFLCIFGLRGDKHEFEAQIGLKCAAKLKNRLDNLRKIISVSIGVTTGMTYCGVVGHAMRREYTVIGMAVNKAARLMVAYTGKVVCDRESFLFSRLQAKHFVLQGEKHLKGISNVGPVYEFLEKPKFEDTEIVINLYPLLGREIELKLFKLMLADVTKNFRAKIEENVIKKTCNLLIIRGEPRIGKSRLLDEISAKIPKHIGCNYINLISADRETPFGLIHLIFSGPLQFSFSTSSEIRENTLLTHLCSIRYPEYLCCLNPVFNVKFRVSSYYINLSTTEKQSILKKLISKLAQSCFDQPWVVMTDDAENADKASLAILPSIIDHNHIFFIFTFGEMEVMDRKRQITQILEKAKVIDLMGLDKWFHASLACQLLNVSAIPAELEKVIQEKSLGNPGWVESYLVSLLQVGAIELREIPKTSLHELGLVAPPSIMLEQRKFNNLTDNKTSGLNDERTDGWRMYEASYGESDTRINLKSDQKLSENAPTASQSDSKGNQEKLISVCLLPRGSLLEDVNSEVTMDVLILKLFDSLSPLDQHLLKCAAVVGETVDRNMLEKLMEDTPIYDQASAICNLFQMRILGCASGDFVQNQAPIMFFRNIKSPSLRIEIKCECVGVKPREELKELPKFASCLLMRFKIAKFRETTYSLLTEYQKIELHKKALKFLQRNTTRCSSCGGGPFPKLLGKDREVGTRESKKILNEFDHLIAYDDTSVVTDDIEEERHKSYLFLGCSATELGTLSNVDFTDCQCSLILISAYTQILQHCRSIDRKDKTLIAILEFVEVLLTTYNVAHATKLLGDAEEILYQIFGTAEDDLVTFPLLKAKIKTLQGKCHLQIRRIDEALKCFKEAIESLGYDFPKTTPLINMKSMVLLNYQKLMLRYCGRYLVGVDEGDAADYNDQLAKCLSQLFVVFRIKQMRDHARLAAIWSLNSALTSNKDFVTLCHAFANMIETADNYHYHNIIPWLEDSGIAFCNQKKNMEMHELKAVVELYTKICFSKFLRSETMQASNLGDIALKFAKTVKSVRQELMIFPGLIQTFIVEEKLDKIIPLMKELEITANSIVDQSGRLWYYAFCIDLQLECGITISSFKKCEQFYRQEGEPEIHLNDPEAKKRFFTCMWLWCLRMGDWEGAAIWKQRTITINYSINELTVLTAVTALKNLEGLIIYYVNKKENRNSKAARDTMLEIQRQFKMVHKVNKFVRVCLLRYTLLRAYYYMVQGRRKKAQRQLNKFKQFASQLENKLITSWANHCRNSWMSSSEKPDTSWQEICLQNENTEKIIHYVLPLPRIQ